MYALAGIDLDCCPNGLQFGISYVAIQRTRITNAQLNWLGLTVGHEDRLGFGIGAGFDLEVFLQKSLSGA